MLYQTIVCYVIVYNITLYHIIYLYIVHDGAALAPPTIIIVIMTIVNIIIVIMIIVIKIIITIVK